MDAKRRRLMSESPGRSRESSAGRSNSLPREADPLPSLDPATLPPIDLFKSDDLPAIDEAVVQLKKMLVSKEAIGWFIKLEDRLASLIGLLNRAATNTGSTESGWSSILRSLVSLLGNMCNFSQRVCFELALPRIRYPNIASRLLESGGRTCAATKASVLRLTANLCQKKESARSVASCVPLIDRVAAMMEDESEAIRSNAFRVIRLLVERNLHKAVLLSNVGFYLGKLLLAVHENEKRAAPVVATLTQLTRYSAKDTGRQLSTSDCVPLLLAAFLAPAAAPQPQRDLLLSLAAGSIDLRERLGEQDIISTLTREDEEGRISEKERCALLATFTQDAWGRKALRESGALDVLCGRLAEATESTAEKAMILVSFRHLLHDTESMAHLCRSRRFIDCVIKDVKEYVECYGEECEPISLRDRDTSHRPWSPILVEPEMRQERRQKGERRQLEGQPLSLSYSASSLLYSPVLIHPHQQHASSVSPQSSSHAGSPPPTWSRLQQQQLSPPSLSLSPPSSSHQSPEHPDAMSSPSRSITFSMSDRGSTTGEEPSMADDEDETERERKLMKQVIDNELWLVGWQANEDANLPYLLREELVTCLLSLLRLVSPHSTRLGRPLKRMATSRNSIEALLSMHFHSRLFHTLCTPPCRLTRFARRCKRCEQDADFGSEILRDFSASVDSDFGHDWMMKRQGSEEREERVAAALAKISLIRNRFRLSRRPSGERSSLQVLLEELTRILLERDYDGESTRSLYPAGPPVPVLIIGALSTLLDPARMADAFEMDTAWKLPAMVECRVKRVEEERRGEEEETPPISQDGDEEKVGRDKEKARSDEEKRPELVEGQDLVTFEDSKGTVLGEVTLTHLRAASQYFDGMFSSDMVEARERRRRFVIDEGEENCTSEQLRLFMHCLAGCEPSLCLAGSVDRIETCMALISLADKYLCPALSSWMLGPHGPARRLLDGGTLHLLLPLALQLYAHHRVMDACLVILLRFSSDSNVSQALASIAGEPKLVQEFIEKLRAFIQSNATISV